MQRKVIFYYVWNLGEIGNSMSLNKVLLEHSRPCSLAGILWLSLQIKGKAKQLQQSAWPAKVKIFPSWTTPDPWPKESP